MKKLILLMIVLVPYVAFAGTDCRVIEYPDHFEAICNGDAAKTTALSHMPVLEQQTAVPEQTFAALMAAQEQRDPDAEVRVEMSGLGKLHAAAWLKSLRGN